MLTLEGGRHRGKFLEMRVKRLLANKEVGKKISEV